jgi:hypothetical protein
MNLRMLLRFILVTASTYIPHLNSLCLSFPSACEEMVYQLQMIIEPEKLLANSMIRRIINHILLKCN